MAYGDYYTTNTFFSSGTSAFTNWNVQPTITHRIDSGLDYPAPKPQTEVERLMADVESVCALGRAA